MTVKMNDYTLIHAHNKSCRRKIMATEIHSTADIHISWPQQFITMKIHVHEDKWVYSSMVISDKDAYENSSI